MDDLKEDLIVEESNCSECKKEYNVSIGTFMFGRPSGFGCGNQGTCNGK